MKFPRKTLRLISLRTGTGQKSNKPYAFVKLADEATFENVELLVGSETDINSLNVQTRYEAELDIEGDFKSVNLFPVATKEK